MKKRMEKKEKKNFFFLLIFSRQKLRDQEEVLQSLRRKIHELQTQVVKFDKTLSLPRKHIYFFPIF
jgi:CII-binding regulator of phage lambda lysogenization HflD